MAITPIKTIDDVSVGDFVKYSDKDKRGKFNYVGEVIHVDKKLETFEMMTFIGDMGFCLTEVEDEYEPATVGQPRKKKEPSNQVLEKTTVKPKGWAKFKKNPEKFTEENLTQKEVKPQKTQKQKVFDLVKANKRKKLAGLLKLAKKEIGGDEKQLTVQIQLALKRLR